MRSNFIEKMRRYKNVKILMLLILATFLLVGCTTEIINVDTQDDVSETGKILEDEYYLEYEDVLEYIIQYNKLPYNYLTKKEAIELGWKSNEGNLWEIEEGLSIGGDKFFNREGKLPVIESRQYYECDVNYNGGYRGADRLIYSTDGLIYFTNDHYKTFTLVYGDE